MPIIYLLRKEFKIVFTLQGVRKLKYRGSLPNATFGSEKKSDQPKYLDAIVWLFHFINAICLMRISLVKIFRQK